MDSQILGHGQAPWAEGQGIAPGPADNGPTPHVRLPPGVELVWPLLPTDVSMMPIAPVVAKQAAVASVAAKEAAADAAAAIAVAAIVQPAVASVAANRHVGCHPRIAGSHPYRPNGCS